MRPPAKRLDGATSGSVRGCEGLLSPAIGKRCATFREEAVYRLPAVGMKNLLESNDTRCKFP
jgi:hypothetical protein